MLKKFILVENNKYYQYSSTEEIIKHLLGNNYYNLSAEDKKRNMEINAMLLSKSLGKAVVSLKEDKNIDIDNSFVLYDEITYVLSVLLTGKVMLLESKDANIFVKGIELDKENMEDNYIIVNNFAKEIILNYIKNI